MTDILMPQLSDQMTEGTIAKWLVDEGAEVAVGEELVEIETDKATMAHPADVAGTVAIVAPEGASVPVGELIARIGDRAPDSDALTPPAAIHSEPVASAPVAISAPAVAARAGSSHASSAGVDGGQAATPVARRIAAMHDVALADVAGSGPHGRVTKRDVLRAAGLELAEEPGFATVAAPASRPVREEAPPEAVPGETRVVEPTRLQDTIARRMSDQALVPVFQVQTDVEMTAALGLRGQLKAAAGDRPAPSVNDLIVRACALALRDHERVNGSFQGGRFVLHEHVHVGVAVAADAGLLVVTLRDTDVKSLGAVAAESRSLATRARDGGARPEDLTGATFTVSNLGMFGMTQITAVINPPQAAILGVGAVRPVLERDEAGDIVDRQLLALNLTCDHRILNGADGAAFLRDVKALLEEPLRLAL